MAHNQEGDVAASHLRHEAANLFRLFAGKHPEFLILALVLTSIPSAVLVLALVLSHGDITEFHPLDLPSGFRSGPEGRGTLSLVWSCVSTIFTLIYVSVHLDVPNEQKDAPSRNCFSAVTRSIWRSIRSNLPLIFWMLINVFAPSLLVLVASMEYQSARDGVEFMTALSKHRGEPHCRWTRRHAFFADMGGFEHKGEPLRTGRQFYEYVQDNNLYLDCDKIREEIRDRSNKNTVLKVLTFFQASWFIAQSIVRGIERRAISQLEVTTCAYIFSLMAAYLFWIRKPYHINGRIPLEFVSTKMETSSHSSTPSPSIPSPLPVLDLNSPVCDSPADAGTVEPQRDVEKGDTPRPIQPRPTLFSKISSSKTVITVISYLRKKLLVPLPDKLQPPDPVFRNAHFSPFNRSVYRRKRSWSYSCFTSGTVGALVGLIHLLPFWDWQYTNPMGQPLWRVCGIVQVVLPLTLATNSILERYMPERWLRPLWIGVVVMSFAYCVSRFVIFVLIWYSFASLPDAVYDSIDWSWFPHWY